MISPLTVLKFGSSVLPSEDRLGVAVREIAYWRGKGHRVIAVVSALGDTTDRLLEQAGAYRGGNECQETAEAAVAALLATGELTTVALLALALGHAGLPAAVVDSASLCLATQGPILDSKAVSLGREPLLKGLARRGVVVVPGFLGRDDSVGWAQTSLLGRGGSDLTALFIAGELRAEQCILVKDVDGLYDSDPAANPDARRYGTINYADVLALDEGIVQHKAVKYARDTGVRFTVAASGRFDGTLVWEGATVSSGLPVEATVLKAQEIAR